MLNNPFEGLRRRMTWVYGAIFALLITVVVASAYTLVWRSILTHEKELLVGQIHHEIEEWLATGEKPCSAVSIREGSTLAYFVGADGKTVVLDQLGDGEAGKLLFKHRGDWPKEEASARMVRFHGGDGQHYRYLAGVASVVHDGALAGRLYMFKNMDFYYAAAARTLFWLACIALLLLCAAAYAGYLLAGRHIRPIRLMYERQQQFTADASHEMRTPLAVMKLAVEGMEADEESKYSDFARESLSMTHSEVERMVRLTENLMALARSDAGILQAEHELVNLSRLCDQTADKLSLVASSRGIALSRRLQPHVQVLGDEHALQRLVIILVDNALKYSSAGTEVTISLAAKGDVALLQVRDQGVGIRDEDKSRIFDRFYRVDKARSRSMDGLGLGLALARSIVREHQGEIKAMDNKPGGTVMEVRLPKITL